MSGVLSTQEVTLPRKGWWASFRYVKEDIHMDVAGFNEPLPTETEAYKAAVNSGFVPESTVKAV